MLLGLYSSDGLPGKLFSGLACCLHLIFHTGFQFESRKNKKSIFFFKERWMILSCFKKEGKSFDQAETKAGIWFSFVLWSHRRVLNSLSLFL